MKKKGICILLAAGIVITSLPSIKSIGAELAPGATNTPTAGINETNTSTITPNDEVSKVEDFVFDASNGAITAYNGTAGILKIPEEINGVKVKKILAGSHKAFTEHGITFVSVESADKIKKVIIPSSVEVIGKFAFLGCYNIKEVEFSEGLKYIGDSAFFGTSLEKVEVPDSVTTIGDGAFTSIDELKQIKIPTGLKQISNISKKCPNLETVTMSKDTVIDSDIFKNSIFEKNNTDSNGFYIVNNTLCGYSGSAEIVNIPQGVTRIGTNVFSENTNVKKIIVPDSVNYIGYCGFENCKNLSEVEVQNSKAVISENCFAISNTYDRRYIKCIIKIDNKDKKPVELNYSNFDFDKETGTITGYRGNDTILEIPKEIDGVRVKNIEPSKELKSKGYGILGDNLTVQEVKMPYYIERIKEGAFKNSLSLERVEIGGCIKEDKQMGIIEPNVFEGCTKITEIGNLKISAMSREAIKGTPFEFNLQNYKQYEEFGGFDIIIFNKMFLEYDNLGKEQKPTDTPKGSTTSPTADSNQLFAFAIAIMASTVVLVNNVKKKITK